MATYRELYSVICSHVIMMFMRDMQDSSVMIVAMYVETIPNRNSRPAILLREGWREGKQIRKRTLANLSDWPPHKIDTLRRLLGNEPLVSPQDLFSTVRSVPHGHVAAILGTIRTLGLETRIGSKRTRERDLVLAMLVDRLIHHSSKLGTTRLWKTTTLAEELAVEDADVEELYDALDWLLARKAKIERGLAKQHLRDGALVLYDVSSSYYYGAHCSLAQYGHDRDGKKGLPIIVWGLMADAEGRPVAVDVYPGNTGDPTTVPDQVEKLREQFGLSRVVLVGDRGLLTETKLETLKQHPGLGWISALKSPQIRDLIDRGALQLSLFDQQNLAEIHALEYPGERLVACFNPLLAEERRRKREALLQATEKELARIARAVQRRTRTPLKKAEIGLKVGRVIDRYKVAKHLALEIEDGRFAWKRHQEGLQREATLDGIYVIRTSEAAQTLSAPETVRSYKSLSQAERAFRCLKGLDLRIRPIRHRTEEHVPAHILLCMLAYYVEWHMRKAWAPILFEDDELDKERQSRDPVAPARASASARRKKGVRVTPEGLEVQSFETMLAALGTRCRNTCRVRTDSADAPTFQQITEPTPLQRKAMVLLGL